MPAMSANAGWIDKVQQGGTLVLRVGGPWLVADARMLDQRVRSLTVTGERRVRLDLGAVDALDTVGAWLLLRLRRDLAGRGLDVTLENLPAEFLPLLQQVEKRQLGAAAPPPERRPGLLDLLALLGATTVHSLGRARDLLGFFGLVVVTLLESLRHPGRVRLVALAAHMQRAGVAALPIVGLLSFLIGVVFAFQGADQLRRFGAEIYTVNMLGIAILRELGVLLTAIIIAGRSGSAFTAEIGAMQVNEEIDALRTLGLNPVEVLVLPRLFALVITLPLLTFYANFMGLLGGALMCWVALGITLPVYLQQLQGAISDWTFWLGTLKAPFFAISIALIGCHQGLAVTRSAESVGRLTTLSVVQSIFLVIIIDAAFSILFSRLGI
jgi:phospholipid/cholesterol/gamma-HCH transport system permease protein